MATKYFCDRCGEEMGMYFLVTCTRPADKEPFEDDGELPSVTTEHELCGGCFMLIRQFLEHDTETPDPTIE
jgi:hypothetical protein